ncbi:MAG: carboxypeptidase-like regulatory domain-containing protein, partial [Planctomycetota bacterium]
MKRILLLLILSAVAIAVYLLIGEQRAAARRAPSGWEEIAGKDPEVGKGAAETADDTEPAGVVVRGQVQDVRGLAIADARVRLLTPWAQEKSEATTGEDGRFVSSSPTAGLLQCLAAAPGYIPAAGPWLEVGGRKEVDAGTLVLARGGLSISGHVVDVNGAGLPEIELYVESETPDEAWARREEAWEDLHTESDADGRFTFAGLREGLYRVRTELVVAGEWNSVTKEHVKAGTEDLRVELSQFQHSASFRLSLRVTLPDGSLLPRGVVAVHHDSASKTFLIREGVADVDLSGRPPFAFYVSHPTTAERKPLPLRLAYEEGLPAGQHKRTLVLEPGAQMRGRVAAAGAPLAGAVVRARPFATYRRHLLGEPDPTEGLVFAAYAMNPSVETTTDESGCFTLDGMLDGHHIVEARYAGYRPARRFVPAVAGDESVVIEMVPTVRQDVRVEAPAGSILGGGHFILWELSPAGPAYASSQATSLGRKSRSRSFTVTFDKLTSGAAYRLRVRSGNTFAPATIDLVAGGETVVVPLTEGEVLAGRVVREDGAPVAGATVQATPSLPPWTNRHLLEVAALVQPKTTTDLAGNFRLQGLTDDPVQVRAVAPGLVQEGGPRSLLPGGDDA